jgi:hypothetical protein
LSGRKRAARKVPGSAANRPSRPDFGAFSFFSFAFFFIYKSV